MAGPLASAADIEDRLGRALSASEITRVEAAIDDASGMVYTWLQDDDAFSPIVPASVKGIVCQAVLRAFGNPRGLTGETLGDYSWQANGGPSTATGYYFTAYERRILRRAHRSLSVRALDLEGYTAIDEDQTIAFGIEDLFGESS
jgi:hypothetical protein